MIENSATRNHSDGDSWKQVRPARLQRFAETLRSGLGQDNGWHLHSANRAQVLTTHRKGGKIQLRRELESDILGPVQSRI